GSSCYKTQNMFPSLSPELHASVDHERTRIRAAAVVSGVSSGLVGTWIFARERADQMLASKIVGRLCQAPRRLTQTPLQSLPLKTAATTIAGWKAAIGKRSRASGTSPIGISKFERICGKQHPLPAP